MGVKITSRALPGVGQSQQMSLTHGRSITVVTRRDGLFDLVLEDGAGAVATLTLGEGEADALAGLLGTPKLMARLAAMQREADALLVEQLPIPRNSPFAERPLADTRARTRTGASIVAVVRGGAAQPAPGPDFVLESGDLVVTVGTREGIDQVARILDGTG